MKFGWSSPFLGDRISLKSRPKVRNPTSRILLNLWVPSGSNPLLTIVWDKCELWRVSKCLTRFDRLSDEIEATVKINIIDDLISTIFKVQPFFLHSWPSKYLSKVSFFLHFALATAFPKKTLIQYSEVKQIEKNLQLKCKRKHFDRN